MECVIGVRHIYLDSSREKCLVNVTLWQRDHGDDGRTRESRDFTKITGVKKTYKNRTRNRGRRLM